jgi:glycine/D-amino acid oxidase-like deaminating enzyme
VSRVNEFDAVVIGAGFYGCRAALALRQMGKRRVLLIDREARIMQRASYANQARIHNGYHYPRSIPTGSRSRANFARFCDEYSFAVTSNAQHVYAIAQNSRVSPGQFEHFCRVIGAPCQPAPRSIVDLFDPYLINRLYLTKEFAFDSVKIAGTVLAELRHQDIDIRLGVPARVLALEDNYIDVAIAEFGTVRAPFVFNCTYADIDSVGAPVRTIIKRELAEIALIDPPREIAQLGITVVDGPFFSTMPFPAERCYSLTHVRYTPHESRQAQFAPDNSAPQSHATFMLRDAQRYLPCLRHARYRRSLFEYKAVLARNEIDDGRPILFEHSVSSPRLISILGGKIDNIYDMLTLLKSEAWSHV